jgi:four helix bundle protein
MRQRYRELPAWQHAVALFRDVYLATESMAEGSAEFAFHSRRAAVAVFMNIEEAVLAREQSSAQRFLRKACTALLDTEMQLRLALRNGHIEAERVREMLQFAKNVSDSLHGLLGQDLALGNAAAQHQPDSRHLENNQENADQEIYVPESLGGGHGWDRHSALAE